MAQSENELKYELTESSYQRLLELAPHLGEPLLFRNIYFKAAEAVERRDWVLRLRTQQDGASELTLKIGREVSPGMFASTEYSCEVSSDRPCDWVSSEPLEVYFREISTALPVLQGEAQNKRSCIAGPLGPVSRWEVDRTVLADGSIFFELEIEWEEDQRPSTLEVAEFRRDLEFWMDEQGLGPISPSRKTKYRRFLDSLGSGPE